MSSHRSELSLVEVKEEAQRRRDDPETLDQREKALLLASVGTELSVIREAASDVRTSRLLAPTMKITAKPHQELHTINFSPDGKMVTSCGAKGLFDMYHVYGNCEGIGSIQVCKDPVHASGFTHSGKEVWAAGDDCCISFWNLEQTSIIKRYGRDGPESRRHTSPITDAKQSADEQLFVSVDQGGSMLVWDLRTKQSVQRVNMSASSGPTPRFLCASWGRRDKTTFLGTDRGTIVMYDLRRGTKMGPIEEFGRQSDIDNAFETKAEKKTSGLNLKRTVTGGAASSPGDIRNLKRISTNSPLYQISGRGSVAETISIHQAPRITGMEVNPDGDALAVFSSDNQVSLYSADYVSTTKERLLCHLPPGPCHNFEKTNLRVAWHAKGQHLAVGSADRNVYVYENAHRFGLGLSPDPENGVTAGSSPYGASKKIQAFAKATANPSLAHVFDGHISCVTGIAWHPRDNIIGSVGTDGQIILGEVVLS